jgi:lipopolysaccharide export system protein LptA
MLPPVIGTPQPASVTVNEGQTATFTVVATGNVKIVQLERRATSQKATFHQDENKMVLDGEAVIREGENVIRGERVIYYVDEERSVVEGGKGGRVNTTITPPKKD